MFKWLTSTKHGFTLVELMIVLVLMGLGSAALINLFNITYKSFNKAEERYVKQEEVERVATLLQSGTNIASALSVEIYDTLDVVPPNGTRVDDAAYLYTNPNDGFLYVREAGTENPHRISTVPLYIYFEAVQKREMNGMIYPDDRDDIPLKNQCGMSCSINAVENDVSNLDYPLDSEDVYYTIFVSYHFPNMIERESGKVNLSTDDIRIQTATINQETGEPTATVVQTTDVGNVVKFFSEMSLLSDAVTTDVQITAWCFVATASYGESSLDVGLLCDFRDSILKKSEAGRWFINKYYTYSPPIAEKISQNETLRFLTRIALKPAVVTAYIALNPEWLAVVVPLAGVIVVALVRRKQKVVFDE